MKSIHFVLIASLAVGCASDGYQHRVARGGETLSVVPEYTQVPETIESRYRDNAGTTIATQTTVVGYKTVTSGYSLRLGEERIDERDFYHLAGDKAAEDRIAAARSKGLWMNRLGLGLVVAGSVATFAVPIALQDRTTAKYSVGQWFVTFPIGLALTLLGKRKVEHYQFGADRAFGAINEPLPGWAVAVE